MLFEIKLIKLFIFLKWLQLCANCRFTFKNMQFLIPSVNPLFTHNIVCLWSDIDFPYFELGYCFQALAIQFSTVNWTHGVFAKQGYWRQFLNFRMWRYHKSLCRCQENSEKPHVGNVFFHLFVTSNQWIIRPFANTQLQSKILFV